MNNSSLTELTHIKTKLMRHITIILIFMAVPFIAMAQPGQPVEQWTGKTILLIGAHPDDDSYSMGTLAMLNANGNDIYIAILTTGNVGTQDPDLGMMDLALIRKQEEQAALATMGIPLDHYINLGYDDGMLEYENAKEVVAKLVRLIRTIRPDVLFSFDPGKGSQRWHKADHRASSYLSADAARAAMWPLMFQGQITVEGLEAHTIPEYMLYDSAEEDVNTWVDITEWEDRKVEALTKYVSQFSSGWYDYKGPELSPEEEKEVKKQLRGWIHQHRDGVPVEGFRYYTGLPDDLGR
jgi:LmbE family N-acetylglucosaminyl deacetylase